MSGSPNFVVFNSNFSQPVTNNVGITASNIEGEVIGGMSLSPISLGFGIWGYNGTVYAYYGGPQQSNLPAPATIDPVGGCTADPVDINNNGVSLFNSSVCTGGLRFLPEIGFGQNFSPLYDFLDIPAIAAQIGVSGFCYQYYAASEFACNPLFGNPSGFWISSVQGIDDSNQVLATIGWIDANGVEQSEQGVFSPSPVPEPSAIVLLGTVLVAVGLFRFRTIKAAIPMRMRVINRFCRATSCG